MERFASSCRQALHFIALGFAAASCAPQSNEKAVVSFKFAGQRSGESSGLSGFTFPKNLCYFVNSTGPAITPLLTQNAVCETEAGYGALSGTVAYGDEIEVSVPPGQTHFQVVGVEVPVGVSCGALQILQDSTPYVFKKFQVGATQIPSSSKVVEFLAADAAVVAGSNTVSLKEVPKDSLSGFSSGRSFLKKDRSTADVSCLASLPAALSSSDGALYDFGVVTVGASQTRTMTLTNSGSGAATSIAISTLGIYTVTGGTCTTTLGAGASCTVDVSFAPASAVALSGQLTVNYSDGTSAQSLVTSLTGTGALPAMLSITDGATYDFGSITVGSSSSHIFTVTNSGGSVAMALNAGSLGTYYDFKGGAYPGLSGTCGTALAPGGSCTIDVQFSPLSGGLFNGSLDLSYSDGAVSQMASRALAGTGVPSAVLASVTITNANPTNATLFNLSYGSVTGSYADYCILENDTNLGNCSFIAGSLPPSFIVSATNDSKTLSFWLKNSVGDISPRVDSNAVSLDTVVPTASGSLIDLNYWNDAINSPTVTLSATATDAGGAINHYEYAIGTSPGSTNVVGWTPSGMLTMTSFAGLSLTNGTLYYYSFRAVDNAGNSSNVLSSDGWMEDLTPPSTPSTITFSRTVDNFNYFNVNWGAATDALSAVGDYQLSLGTVPGGSDIVPWTWVGSPATGYPVAGLMLAPATTYYFNVRAKDTAGNLGTPFTNSFTTWDGGTWSPVNPTGAPSARTQQGAGVFTGTQFLVWGGYDNSTLSTGGLYDPVANSWMSTSLTGVPAGRYDHTMTYDFVNNKAMILGGGSSTAKTFDDSANTWMVAATLPGVVAAQSQVITSGGYYIIWSPNNNNAYYYASVTSPGTWSSTTTFTGGGVSPGARQYHSTTDIDGTHIMIWGGMVAGNPVNTGAILDQTIDGFTPIATANAPTPRGNHAAVLIPSTHKVVIWGGSSTFNPGAVNNDGAIYDYDTNTWQTMALPPPSFAPRADFAYGWDSNRFFVWGGHDQNSNFFNNGALYNPATNTWALTAPGPLSPRRYPSFGFLSTVNKFFIWGGDHYPTYYNDGALFQSGL